MKKEELNKLFIKGKCEELSKQGYIDEFDCRKLYRNYKKDLVGKCKCKYKGISKSHCKKFQDFMENSS